MFLFTWILPGVSLTLLWDAEPGCGGTDKKSDSEIKTDVDAELRWSPEIDETDIATKVKNGVVTLSGFVHTYHEKYRAEAITKQVAGVSGVANDIEVRLGACSPSDPEIARDAVVSLFRVFSWGLVVFCFFVLLGHVSF